MAAAPLDLNFYRPLTGAQLEGVFMRALTSGSRGTMIIALKFGANGKAQAYGKLNTTKTHEDGTQEKVSKESRYSTGEWHHHFGFLEACLAVDGDAGASVPVTLTGHFEFESSGDGASDVNCKVEKVQVYISEPPAGCEHMLDSFGRIWLSRSKTDIFATLEKVKAEAAGAAAAAAAAGGDAAASDSSSSSSSGSGRGEDGAAGATGGAGSI